MTQNLLLHGKDQVHVAATAQVLACLMAAPQSKYSWHLLLTKIDKKIIIDKANGSIVDLLTVNETSSEPPMQDAEVGSEDSLLFLAAEIPWSFPRNVGRNPFQPPSFVFLRTATTVQPPSASRP